MTAHRVAAGDEIKPARFAVNDGVQVLDEDTGAAGRAGERARSGWSPSPGRSRSATTTTRRRPRRRSASSTASATRSPATTRPSTPTARSAPRSRLGLHQHRRREGLPRGGRARAARAPRRLRLPRGRACPTTASASRSSRSSSRPRRDGADEADTRRVVPAAASSGTSGRSASCSSTRWPAPPPGRPTTATSRISPPGCVTRSGDQFGATAVRSRPARFAAYSAESAAATSSSAAAAWSGIVATPALRVTWSGTVASTKAARTRSAASTASLVVQSGRTTASRHPPGGPRGPTPWCGQVQHPENPA